jgi:3'(2'), 5'-bisphosphate nucleotidase
MQRGSLQRELEVATKLAREAGRVILEVYAKEFDVIEKSGGGGPVTEADHRASELVVEGLRRAFPSDGVVSEENPDTSDARRFSRCWYVDPLDGTREFVDRNGMFAVHVGLSIDAVARAGVVYQPVGDRLYAGIVGQGCHLEEGGRRTALHVTDKADPAQLRLVVSRSHKSPKTAEVVAALGIADVVEQGSVGLKAGLVAEGAADLYLHPSSKSWRWDCCAPEAVLRGAGGVLTEFSGAPLRYDGTELQNTRGLLGCNLAAFERVREVTARIARESGLSS